MLLVRGPSIFGGYFKYDGPSPFVSFAGKQWYRTGDLVSEDGDGILTFCGRLKRFVKIGGEMIPLAAVEAALEAKWQSPEHAEGPSLAVECTPDEEHPELVLFTTLAIDREAANRSLREAGLSPLHNIRRVVRLEVLPLLGTGKTDYRALKAMLGEVGP
jgi:acyl-[acyl-carrier-protein]-phospholipid O-acyltransferase/long-chain-fatty-acid--[acyl-carrier-protein] ligase